MSSFVTGNLIHADVCVIGGGPAGAALAGRLRQLGHSVVVVEKHSFPRPHIGESLVGNVLPLLDLLEVRSEIENAGFLRPEGTIIRWAGAVETRPGQGQPGFQVDRGRFDQILLLAAAKAGALVLQPARATRPKPAGEGGWQTMVQATGSGTTAEITIKSKFVADASGRPGLLAGKKVRSSRKTLALYAYWRDVPFAGPDTRVEAGDDEWYWGAPLPGGDFNAVVFVDAMRCRSGIAATRSLEAFYKTLIARSELLSICLRGSLMGPVRACDATQFYDDAPASENTIKLGEAAFSIDPLSSQGVQTALGSAVHAAAVVHTMLQRPEDTTLALEFYRQRQLASVEVHRVAAAGFYRDAMRSRSGAFWEERILGQSLIESQTPGFDRLELTAQTKISLASDVQFQTIPIIQGDFIVPATALVSPALPRPIAFLDGILIAPLVAMMRGPMDAALVVQIWSDHISADRAKAIMRWLGDAGLLRAVKEMNSSSHYRNAESPISVGRKADDLGL